MSSSARSASYKLHHFHLINPEFNSSNTSSAPLIPCYYTSSWVRVSAVPHSMPFTILIHSWMAGILFSSFLKIKIGMTIYHCMVYSLQKHFEFKAGKLRSCQSAFHAYDIWLTKPMINGLASHTVFQNHWQCTQWKQLNGFVTPEYTIQLSLKP